MGQLFVIRNLYMKFQNPNIHGLRYGMRQKVWWTDGRTNRQTKTNQYAPPTFLGGIKMKALALMVFKIFCWQGKNAQSYKED